jgi:hypothetical protein
MVTIKGGSIKNIIKTNALINSQARSRVQRLKAKAILNIVKHFTFRNKMT